MGRTKNNKVERGKGRKGRSAITFQLKLNRLEKTYKRLFKKSNQSKNKNTRSTGNSNSKKRVFFCDKYKTFDSFLKVNSIKKSNKQK